MCKIKFQYNDERTITDCKVEIGEEVLHGTAKLNPIDNFSRRKGRKVALTNAISELSRPKRAYVWEIFHSKCKI